MAIFEVKEDSIHHIINLNVGGIFENTTIFFNLILIGCLSAGEKVQVFDRNFLITGIHLLFFDYLCDSHLFFVATDEGQVIIWEESNIVENMGLLKI